MALVFADANAYAMGNIAGPFAITAATNDTLSISVDGGSAQVFTLTAGASRTAAQIVTDLSALTSATASVITIGTSTYVQIKSTSASNNSSSILINAPSHNAAATLGFIVTTYFGGTVVDGATGVGSFTGATKQNITDGLEAALLSAGWITISGHGTGTLIMQCSVTPPGAGSLIGQITVKTANTNCTSISIQNVSGSKASGNGTNNGFMLLPAAAKVFKVVACKHQFFIFTAGSTATAREYAAAGVLFIPTFLQGSSGVFEAIWGHGNAQSDTTSTVPQTFRTSMSTGTTGGNMCNQAVIVNGTLGEAANNSFSPGGGTNHGIGTQCLCVSVEAYSDSGGLIGPAWWDGSFDVVDPIMSATTTALGTQALRVGQLFNAAIVMTSFTADITDTFNGHNWWFLTANNTGAVGGTLGTLLIATS